MSRHFTCPQGHEWSLSATSSSLSAHLDPVCPVCGAPAQVSAADTGGKADSESAQMSVASAPAESKARVPAPLPVREAHLPAPVAARASENVWAQKMQAAPRVSPPTHEPPAQPESAASAPLMRQPRVIALTAALGVMVLGAVIAAIEVPRRLRAERQVAQDARQEALLAHEKSSRMQQAEEAAKADASSRVIAADQARNDAIEQLNKSKSNADRADKNARELDRQRQEQVVLRERAEVAAKVAEESRDEAQKTRGEAEGRLAHLYSGQGMRALDRGELPESFVWLTEALRLAPADPRREAAHRFRLAIVLAGCPRPMQAWFHDKPVTHAEISTDGRRVLTVAKDGKARLFDATTGQPIGEALTATGAIEAAHFNRDGRQIATVAADQMARVWDAATGKAITPPQEHPGIILAHAFSSDGKRLYTISRAAMPGGTEFHTWNAASGEAIGDPWQFGHPVQTAGFTPDRQHVLSIGPDGRVYLTGFAGKDSAQVFGTAGTVRRITFSEDGLFAGTCGSDKTARVWNVAKRTTISPPLLHPDQVQQIAISPDGQRAATSCTDRFIRVWNVGTGQRILALRQPSSTSTVTFSPDGRHLLTAGQDGVARIWDAESGVEVMPALWHGGAILPDAVFGNDGARLLTADEQTVRLWDLTAGEPLTTGAGDKPGERLTYSPDGKHFIRVTGDSVQLHATDTGKPIGETIKHKNDISLTAFSADGRRLLTIGQKPGQDSADVELRVSDTATGKPVGPPIEAISLVQHAALSPDGARLAAATAEQKVYVWECATGREIDRPLDLRQNVTHVLFSPDGAKLVTATVPGDVRVTDPATGEPLAPAMKHGQPVTLVAVTADSKRLITARVDGSAQVLDAITGETLAGPFSHGSTVSLVSMSDDGNRAVTAGADGTARIWDAKTGKPAAPPLHHDNAVSQAAFSPDGRWLATASGDRVHIWDAATGESLGPDIKPWRGGATVRLLEFTKEGRIVAGHGQPSDPHARQTLPIEPENRTAAELAQLGMVLTGHRVDNAGAFTAADANELRKAWETLRAKSPRDFAASPERLLAWHRRGADECEQNKQWAGVLRHVERLAELEPKRSEHRARRARTFAALGRLQDAVAEYRKALDVEPNNAELLAGIARAELDQKKWQPATEWLDRAVAVTPDDRDLWALRGRAFAELGKLDKAAADFDKAMSLGQSDAAIWYQRNLLRLAAGDLDSYRKACLRMVRRFGEGDTANTRYVGWTCSLGPEAIADLKLLLRRAERAITEFPASMPNHLAFAGLLYRTGQFDKAEQVLEPIIKTGGEKTAPILMAMIQHRLGRTDEAKKGLEKTAKPDDPAIIALAWDDRLAYQLLRREAETLLKTPKP